MRVFTVGHGTRPIGELLEVLDEAGTRTLVDVRRFPSSRRHPQFDQPALAAALENAGIAYRHAVELRAISNSPEEADRTRWRFDEAFAALAAALKRLDVL